KKEWRIRGDERFSPGHARWLATSPDMIWQYAQHLQHEFEKQGYKNVRVYAISSVSLNREPYRLIADSTVNLAEVPWNYVQHNSWITAHKKEK
ncbi:MAG: hypothetical protein EOO01_09365, partial [Chitinophagaceae bacterium]